jgi:hypothetical protein
MRATRAERNQVLLQTRADVAKHLEDSYNVIERITSCILKQKSEFQIRVTTLIKSTAENPPLLSKETKNALNEGSVLD